MMTVKDVFAFLDAMAPVSLAEDYDNPGILVGMPDGAVKKALLTLDITPEAAREAADFGAQLVISHHPVIFRPVRSVLSTIGTAAVWELARLSLSAICMHTNLDSTNGGVNDALAVALGLCEITRLQKHRGGNYKKITVFVPANSADAVRAAMANAGAGKLGDYDSCAFEARGTGHFRPLAGSHPFIGKNGVCESVEEVRIEAVCAPADVKKVVAAMLAAHPYELPAYDIFDDEALGLEYGKSRLGRLENEMQLVEFAALVKCKLSTSCVRAVDAGKQARNIAVCGGAADGEFISAAAAAGADTIVTGELKHSLYYTALEAKLNVVEAGHFATETVILPVLRERLAVAFPEITFKIAECNREPYFTV